MWRERLALAERETGGRDAEIAALRRQVQAASARSLRPAESGSPGRSDSSGPAGSPAPEVSD